MIVVIVAAPKPAALVECVVPTHLLLCEVQAVKGCSHIRWYVSRRHHACEVVQQRIVAPSVGHVLDDLRMVLLQGYSSS